jgi:hypothetical protein
VTDPVPGLMNLTRADIVAALPAIGVTEKTFYSGTVTIATRIEFAKAVAAGMSAKAPHLTNIQVSFPGLVGTATLPAPSA